VKIREDSMRYGEILAHSTESTEIQDSNGTLRDLKVKKTLDSKRCRFPDVL